MDKLRQAAEQALEALEEIALAGMSPAPEMIDNKEAFHARQAWRFIGIAARQLTALRAALAEQQEGGVCARCGGLVFDPVIPQKQQEPVAWLYFDSYGDDIFGHPNGYRPDAAVPLYTAPQPRREVELTYEEIDRALDAANVPELPDGYESVELEIARAVIKAYKAKQEDAPWIS